MTVIIETFVRDNGVHTSVKSPKRTRIVAMPQYAPTLQGILAANDFAIAMLRGGRHA